MRERILIIEDEEAIRSILRELLLDAGYEVEEAADGPEGIAKFRAGRFALVLLDLMGARARRLRRLRADTPRPRISPSSCSPPWTARTRR